ncbi:MAG: cytochrome C oxidase subunit IV family protein [Planctomycetaceae bacterium]|nr:cytochrome C oxidase subunit IV family protein [Planctomycetaceae bacterium]
MSDEHHHSHFRTYVTIFLVLCVFTALSWIADLMHMANHNLLTVIVLAIASAKALCVMAVFMHLQFERAWKYLLLAPTLILASAIPFALAPDVGLHYYTVDVPQLHEYQRLNAARVEHSPNSPQGDVDPAHHGNAPEPH